MERLCRGRLVNECDPFYLCVAYDGWLEEDICSFAQLSAKRFDTTPRDAYGILHLLVELCKCILLSLSHPLTLEKKNFNLLHPCHEAYTDAALQIRRFPFPTHSHIQHSDFRLVLCVDGMNNL